MLLYAVSVLVGCQVWEFHLVIPASVQPSQPFYPIAARLVLFCSNGRAGRRLPFPPKAKRARYGHATFLVLRKDL